MTGISSASLRPDARDVGDVSPPTSRRSTIIVAGMHRSGTSAVGGVLHALGVGFPGNLIAGKEDNPRGFFENEQVVEFHERVLKALGSSYDDPTSLDERDLEAATRFGAVEELADLLRGEIGTLQLTAFKDPRACRLLPIWFAALERLAIDPLVLIPLRHPLEVAESLAKRNNLSLPHGLLLWLDHALAAERDSRTVRRGFLHYSDLLSDWRDTAAKVAADLDLVWPTGFERAGQRADAFLSNDLRHHRRGEASIGSADDLRKSVARAWEALCRLHDASDPDAMGVLDELRRDKRQGETLFRSYIAAERDLDASRDGRIQRLEDHALLMDGVSRSKDQEIGEAHRQLTKAGADLARLIDSQATDQERILQQNGELADMDRRHAADRGRIEDLDHQLARLRNDVSSLAAAAGTSANDLAIIQGSASWKVARRLIHVAHQIPAPVRSKARTLAGWMSHRRARLPVAVSGEAPDREDIDRHVHAAIEKSRMFDAAEYEGRHAAALSGLTPLEHYILTGEQQGLRPSAHFDPNFYRAVYPDLGRLPINLLHHYIAYGAAEGRIAVPAASRLSYPEVASAEGRPSVLILVHEASRTGAPILAWNIARKLRSTHRVLVLLLGKGELTEHFVKDADCVIGPLDVSVGRSSAEARFIVREIAERYDIDFVIANSVETRAYAVEFTKRMLPVVSLVHEFASYTRPAGVLEELFTLSDEIVFSADLVKRFSADEYKVLSQRSVHILPQGQSEVPGNAPVRVRRNDLDPKPAGSLRRAGEEHHCLVVGMGTVQHRKGVDLFIAMAEAAMRFAPERGFRFVWFGHGYDPENDVQYSAYLKAQIEISGLTDHLDIFSPTSDLGSVYEQADIFALTSRLDPLPNVAIDASLAGLPLVCFESASGFADILQREPATAALVVPHQDAGAAGRLVAELACDDGERLRLGAAIRQVGERMFDMDAYVASLSRLGLTAAERLLRRREDAVFLRNAGAFDASFYKGEAFAHLTEDEALAHYLAFARNSGAFGTGGSRVPSRRPAPGFHPLRFRRDTPASVGADPFVGFLKAGKPAGPWTHEIVAPDENAEAAPHELRTLLHGHFHYPELVPELLDCLARNRSSCDLFLTTNDDESARSIGEAVQAYDKGKVEIRRVPNRGRDIGPFVSELCEVAKDYDVVGHVHGKRSAHIAGGNGGYGDRWRNFLWQHLLGPDHPMMDTILGRMADDRGIGLVFPEDPHLVGWDENRGIAESIASRMGIAVPLPDDFTFPIGTMFWARTQAMRPLWDLGIGWTDYPDEPLPIDGTILHALERLVPFSVQRAGLRIAATHIPGVIR